MSQTALVITSIAGPDSSTLKIYAKECSDRNVPFIVIGDTKSPDEFDLPGCDFWSVDRQLKCNSKLAPLIPTRHYARKNLGYLIALQNGAATIMETDDDNLPLGKGFWDFCSRSPMVEAYDVNVEGWVNVYRYFSEKVVWPRGLPLEELRKPTKPLKELELIKVCCPIQQGLADGNPDVDAVYRLTYPLPLNFERGIQVALGSNSWCPFNSQNTFWFKKVMPLMYLPAHCSFRMTDIWRSFIAQRISWANGWNVLFHEATVWQERNEHDLLKDFEDEIPGYMNNTKIALALAALGLPKGREHIYDNLIKCYDIMIANGWVGEQEAPMVRAWCEDMSRIAG